MDLGEISDCNTVRSMARLHSDERVLNDRVFAAVRHYLYRYLLSVNLGRPRGASGQSLASHRWGPEFASRSLHVGFVLDETRSG